MTRRNVPPVQAATVAAALGTTASFDVTVTGVSDDTRTVAPGDLFFCVRGGNFDPHGAISDVASAGAVAAVVDRDVDAPAGFAVIRVPDVRTVVGTAVAGLLGRPAERVTVIGVTGTNGKTSTASFIGSILRGCGYSPSVFGTLTNERTTPEPIELQSMIADAVESGSTHIVMEVSSHALVLGRVNGVRFDIAVFTNLSRDHVDFHGSMDDYRAAKFSLFDPSRSSRAIVNVDDPAGSELAARCVVPVIRSSGDDLTGVTVSATSVSYVWRGERVSVPVGGRFTVENSRLALETCVATGIPADAAAQAITSAVPVPGRMQPVECADLQIVVDYAHTPEALRSLLSSLRDSGEGRLTVVFGCGGDRDSGKRPEMGRVAAELADVVWVTSDNPRSEDPLAIISSILEGTAHGSAVVNVQADRAVAIESAISGAGHGDIVVVAGKGHEPYQEIAGVFHEFSDVNAARAAASRRSGTT